jgi:hypothetical protein
VRCWLGVVWVGRLGVPNPVYPNFATFLNRQVRRFSVDLRVNRKLRVGVRVGMVRCWARGGVCS